MVPNTNQQIAGEKKKKNEGGREEGKERQRGG